MFMVRVNLQSSNFDAELDIQYDFYHGVAESQLQWETLIESSSKGHFLIKSSENKTNNVCVLCVNSGSGHFKKFILTKESDGQYRIGENNIHNR